MVGFDGDDALAGGLRWFRLGLRLRWGDIVFQSRGEYKPFTRLTQTAG